MLEGKRIITSPLHHFCTRYTLEFKDVLHAHRLLHLEVMKSKGEFTEASSPEFVGLEGLHSLLLCAPTLNYCNQLAKIVSNSLQLVVRWTQPVGLNAVFS